MPDRNGTDPHAGIWIYGAPGVGKSHWAQVTYPGAFYKEPDNKWWDEYQSERVVILDEFVGSVKLSLLLRWADKYKCKAESKGSMLRLNTHTTVVLSNLPPWELYMSVKPIRRLALYRRFKVYEMVKIAGVRSRILRTPPGLQRHAVPRSPSRRGPPPPSRLVRQNATVGYGSESLSEGAERVLEFAQGFRRSAFTRYSGNGQGNESDE